MRLPPALRANLEAVLDAPLADARSVPGGDINQAAQITAGGAAYFVKWHASAPPQMFPAEAHGLRTLAAAGVIRVPQVIAQGGGPESGPDGGPAYLLLEWIDSGGRRGANSVMARFGAELAALHRVTAETHGLDRDNFIGRLAQPNPRTASWTAFYRDQRIGHQMTIARRLGRLPAHRERLLTRLMDHLPNLLDDDAMPPSLLHGDLWGGNFLIAASSGASGGSSSGDAQPVLIDPAVCYGHREMDLAMTELFGGFSAQFYDAYRAAWPLHRYEERRALYQLYYILVHLNHFGESYGERVDSLAAYYVGR